MASKKKEVHGYYMVFQEPNPSFLRQTTIKKPDVSAGSRQGLTFTRHENFQAFFATMGSSVESPGKKNVHRTKGLSVAARATASMAMAITAAP